jgi:hypothetical protein
MTDPLGQSQVLSYLTGLSADSKIVLISFEKAQRFDQNRSAIEQICATKGIEWYPLIYTKKPPVLSTLYDILRMINKSKKLHRQHSFDIVHCRGYITSIAGLQLKRNLGIKFIFDMRGFWIDEKSEGEGAWNSNNPLYKYIINYLRKKEKAFFIESGSIITLTHAAAHVIGEQFSSLKSKIKVIPTCVNLDVFTAFNKTNRDEVRQKLGISKDDFVLLYSGGSGPNYDRQFLIKTLSHFNSIDKNTWLLILSKDGNDELNRSNKNIISISVPYTEVHKYLMAGDVGIINYVNGSSITGRSPTKLGEYWACGLPAISPAGIGDVDKLFKTYPDSGVVIDDYDFSPVSVSRFKNVNKTQLRKYAEDYFSLEKGVALYREVYCEVTKQTNEYSSDLKTEQLYKV